MTWLHAFIDVPAEQRPATAAFWSAALGWPPDRPWPGRPEFCSFGPPAADAYVHLQEIGGPARVHLDLEVGDATAAVGRAVELGARFVADHGEWRTLQSPGALPFCIVEARDRVAPEPLAWPDGHRSRLVQLCIDSPRPVHDEEVAFWRGLLPGRFVASAAAEFAGKWHDGAGSPLQLLFQRLDEEDGTVRVHLDLGADDVPAEVARLVSLGAEDVGAGHGGWHVLRDAVGLPFCVTGNSPERGVARDLGDLARTDSAWRVVRGDRERVFDALLDPHAVARWLPPTGMTGTVERFDARRGGSYGLVLTYLEGSASGKTTTGSDVVEGFFVDIVPGERVVQAVDFVSDDPSYAGTMTMTWRLSSVGGGTRVVLTAEDVPVGISAEDHAEGMTSTLANLAAFLETD